jgi:hypothetical protein
MTMARWMMTLLLVSAAAAMACGSEPSSDADAAVGADASVVDAAPPDAELPDAYVDQDATLNPGDCPGTYGPGSIAVTFAVGVEADGFDLDGAADPAGDGAPDNALGANEALRNLINANLNSSLSDGSLRLLTELRDLDSLGSDDADMTLVLYGGVDSDVPVNTADDFTGDEDFYYSRDWVEWDDCSPKSPIQSGYAGGVITGSSDSVVFYVSLLGGFIEVADSKFESPVAADTEGARTPAGQQARFGGAIPQCSLAQGDGVVGLSAQHDVTHYFATQPDIDRDGDGLETVQADTAGIISCTDGDGVTVVPGQMCGCDPRMADGYSIAFLLDFRGATVLGPEPE